MHENPVTAAEPTPLPGLKPFQARPPHPQGVTHTSLALGIPSWIDSEEKSAATFAGLHHKSAGLPLPTPSCLLERCFLRSCGFKATWLYQDSSPPRQFHNGKANCEHAACSPLSSLGWILCTPRIYSSCCPGDRFLDRTCKQQSLPTAI